MHTRAALLLLVTLCLALGLMAVANVSDFIGTVDRARTAGVHEDTMAIEPMRVSPHN